MGVRIGPHEKNKGRDNDGGGGPKAAEVTRKKSHTSKKKKLKRGISKGGRDVGRKCAPTVKGVRVQEPVHTPF